MKRCDYCGQETGDELALCPGCGTALPESLPEIQPVPPLIWSGNPPPVIALPKRLGARAATYILLGYLGAQVAAGIGVAVVGGAITLLQGGSTHDPEFAARLTQRMMAPIAVLSLVGSGITVLFMSLRLVRERLRDRSSVGAAWAVGTAGELAQGLVLGLLVAVGYAAFAALFGPHAPDAKMGPLAKMSVTPGWPQLLWIVAALVLAPPVEELLFRGVLYGGYRQSFGPIWAALLTTAIFVLLHLTETIYFLPSILGITALALTALWIRLRFAAVGPAVAVHVGYNAVIAAAVLTYTLSNGGTPP